MSSWPLIGNQSPNVGRLRDRSASEFAVDQFRHLSARVTSSMAAAAEEKNKKMIKVISSDGEAFEMTEAAASMSRILLHMIEDGCTGAGGAGITLPNVAGSALAKVIEYCTKHAIAAAEGSSSSRKAKEELKKFDVEFMEVGIDMLYDLIMAANFMGVEGLLSLAAQRTAELIKGKSPEQIREMFGIKNDHTPEEEEQIRKEYEWAF
ncbi:SKP1-like protein 5 [Oryza glaberrima]|nr:SKP1-like protein 5 [Oryza glaberrima]